MHFWLWKMAWRDSRLHRKRLLLFVSSIIMGVAALVSISSFDQAVKRALDTQAKTLLGADLLISSLQPFSAETETLLDTIGGTQASELLFASMAYFPRANATRLVQVRALAGDYPFYGTIGTEPLEAAYSYQTGYHALVDDALMLQYGIAVGDSVNIGSQTYRITGRLLKLPNEPAVAGTFNPRIYISLTHVDQSLLQRGSLVNYRRYFKFESTRDTEALVEELKPRFNQYRLRYDTVERRKQSIGDVVENFYRFLNLVGFVALLLGSIGVGSAVHVYSKQKFQQVSILRCLGAASRHTFAIFLIQIMTLTCIGAILGALVGVGVQLFLPQVFAEFLPVQIDTFISRTAVVQGLMVGMGIALLFALLPLLSIRKVSPLQALRADFEDASLKRRDPLRILVALCIGVAILAFAVSQVGDMQIGVTFTAGLFAAFAIITVVAKAMMALLKTFFPSSWPYVWRQGLANLYRPNNQTWMLMLSIGLGTFLITTLYLTQHTLLDKVSYIGGENKPNLALFDIQPDQRDDVRALLQSFGRPILQEAAIVTMRIDSLRGQSVADLLNAMDQQPVGDTAMQLNRGLLRWEYRATYRDSLMDTEKIVAGTWHGEKSSVPGVTPLSFDVRAAKQLQIAVGDTIVWNVQGVPLRSVVTSLRKVDWQRVQANFMVVFPTGVLEAAPQIYIMATRVQNAGQSAELQKTLVRRYPNVSVIDLALVLSTVDLFLSKISFIIQVMALFSIFTGLIVLAVAVSTSRFQRIRENILLKTLGASRTQVIQILLVEYALLGGLAALTGLFLSYASGWALAFFMFDAVFMPTFAPFVFVLVAVTALAVAIGMMNNRGIFDRPPLEVLRLEG